VIFVDAFVSTLALTQVESGLLHRQKDSFSRFSYERQHLFSCLCRQNQPFFPLSNVKIVIFGDSGCIGKLTHLNFTSAKTVSPRKFCIQKHRRKSSRKGFYLLSELKLLFVVHKDEYVK